MQHLLQGRNLFTGPTYRRKCKLKRAQIGPYQVSICITVAKLSSFYRRHFAQIFKKNIKNCRNSLLYMLKSIGTAEPGFIQ